MAIFLPNQPCFRRVLSRFYAWLTRRSQPELSAMNPNSEPFHSPTALSPEATVSPFASHNPFSEPPLVPQSPFASIPPSRGESSFLTEMPTTPYPPGPAQPFPSGADSAAPFGFDPLPSPQSSPFSSASPVPEPSLASRSRQPASLPPLFASMEPSPRPQSTTENDASAYQQLELRAIFGVDREMNAEEILQRTRCLPGIRHVAPIPHREMAALDSFKKSLRDLGFHADFMRLSHRHSSIDFFRHGHTTLAVQVDGSFAPGIRESLMIIARELEKLAKSSHVDITTRV